MVRVLLDRNANIQAADDVSREQSSKCLSWRALLRGIKMFLSVSPCVSSNVIVFLSSVSPHLILSFSISHSVTPFLPLSPYYHSFSLTLILLPSRPLVLSHTHPLTLPPSHSLSPPLSSSHPLTFSPSHPFVSLVWRHSSHHDCSRRTCGCFETTTRERSQYSDG